MWQYLISLLLLSGVVIAHLLMPLGRQEQQDKCATVELFMKDVQEALLCNTFSAQFSYLFLSMQDLFEMHIISQFFLLL